jgi:hypothetical protein
MHFFMVRDKKKVVFYGPRKKKFGHHCYKQCSTCGGSLGDGVPLLIFRNFNVPLLLLCYNYNAQQVLGTLFFFFLK